MDEELKNKIHKREKGKEVFIIGGSVTSNTDSYALDGWNAIPHTET